MGLFPSNFAEVLETESSDGGGGQTKVVENIPMAKKREYDVLVVVTCSKLCQAPCNLVIIFIPHPSLALPSSVTPPKPSQVRDLVTAFDPETTKTNQKKTKAPPVSEMHGISAVFIVDLKAGS